MKTPSDNQNNSPMKFPCDFKIKIMGKASSDFEQKAISIVKRHCNEENFKEVSKRHSEFGNYLSITITIEAQDQKQLDAIYIELSATPEILVAL